MIEIFSQVILFATVLVCLWVLAYLIFLLVVEIRKYLTKR